jgi:site-specific DNA recombinase
MNKIRCAIYTRKSSEEGLEQEFNSLHAQREACAAYIASQKHEGWVLLPEHYDDGGISGGTLERPGLYRLMADVDAGLVDQIVVYKIDRLTRSLADFAKLVDGLDAAGASFVSVTQSFNTATSMGRLTLNVLLSFAQFEREVTAERIRDKIAASKKRGLWMGGSLPLGYQPDGRSLKIREDEAAIVRRLFAIYLEHQSLIETTRQAEKAGLRSIPRRSRSGEGASMPVEPVPFARSQVHYILANPVYAGLIRHRQQVHDGLHPAIIERATWDEVQSLLKSGAGRQRGAGASSPGPSPLAGKIFDETGDRMTPTHANKKGVRYRYYVSNRMIVDKTDKGRTSPASGWRLPAKPLEDQIARAVIAHLRYRMQGDLLKDAAIDEIARLRRLLDHAKSQEVQPTPATILGCIARATIAPGKIDLALDPARTADWLGVATHHLAAPLTSFAAPFQYRKRGVEGRMVIGHGQVRHVDATLIRSIVRAQRCYEAIKRGATFEEVAASQGISRVRLFQIIDLAFMAPDIIRSIVNGEQPISLTTKWLSRNPLPSDWLAQRRILATL